MPASRRSAHFGLFAAALVMASGFGVLLVGARRGPQMPKMYAGMQAPQSASMLRDLDGNVASLNNLHGKITVLYFTSIRSPKWVEARKRVNELTCEFTSDSRVQVIAIQPASDVNGVENLRELKVQAAVIGQSFRTLVDCTGNTLRDFDIKSTPTFFVISEDGRIVSRTDGGKPDSNVTKCTEEVATMVRESLRTSGLTLAMGEPSRLR